MISIILPTRHRPKRLRTFLKSAYKKSLFPNDLEFLVYVDDDDTVSLPVIQKFDFLNIKVFTGPRMSGLMEIQNFLYTKSSGDIIGYLSDDIRFLTDGWDVLVKNEFKEDMIYLVCPYEIHKGYKSTPHGFLSRRAIEAVGEFVPSKFVSVYSDKWLEEVYINIGRLIKLDSVHISHDHPSFSKRRVNSDPKLAKYWDDVYRQKNTDRKIKRDKNTYYKTMADRQRWIDTLSLLCVKGENE